MPRNMGAIGRLCGVTENDSKLAAAEKALAVMRLAGFPSKDIRKAEKMVEDYKARQVAHA